MKKLILGIAVVFAVAALVASAALAGGNGKGLKTMTATCTTSGGVTVHASSGQSAWVNGQHWVVLRLTGTFMPTSGTAQTFTKVYGHKTGLLKRSVQSCSGSQTSADGTFAFTATVAKTRR